MDSEQVRITAQLIDGTTGNHVGAGTLERPLMKCSPSRTRSPRRSRVTLAR